MYLSNKLTFSLVFSILFVAALAFVVAPAMADETVTFYGTLTPATAAADGKWEVTFKFSEGGSFAKADFTTVDATVPLKLITMYNIKLGGTVLTKAQYDAAAFTGTKLTVVIPKSSAKLNPDISFTVLGYELGTLMKTETEANAATLKVKPDHFGAKAYRVYTKGGRKPLMPEGVNPVQPESKNMPDNLEEFFAVGGGTIDLNVAGTGKDSRHLVINEVMWAVDNRLVGKKGYEEQQWIEIYNRTSIPVANADISFAFTDNPSGLNPPAATADGTSDRLSNIPSYISTWNVKGQKGTSVLGGTDGKSIIGANPMFTSMYRSNQGKEGWNAGHWTASDTNRPYLPGFVGTPGAANTRGGIPGTRLPPDAFNPAMEKVLINELYNTTGTENDWLEIRALKSTNLEDWTLSVVTAVDTEVEIIKFPKRTIPAGAIWLIIGKDPVAMGVNLASGNDVTIGETANQDPGRGAHKYLIVKDFSLDKVKADSLVILRSKKGWDGFRTRKNLEDVVGTGTYEKKTLNFPTPIVEPYTAEAVEVPNSDPKKYVTQYWNTRVFPLNGQNPGDYNKGKVDSLLNNDNDFAEGKAWARSGNEKGWLRDAGDHAGYRGGIGYDRVTLEADAQGTPGYANNAYQNSGASAIDNVIISEIMYAHEGTTQAAPQWIELYNPSSTIVVDLDKFLLTITNHAEDGMMKASKAKGEISVLLSGMSIPPKQTVLIASANARRDEVSIPDHRIYNAFNKAKADFGMKLRSDIILNPYGFNITLHAKGNEAAAKRQLVDKVGNLAKRRTGEKLEPHERTDTERFDLPPWEWPDGFNEDGDRVSLARANTVTSLEDADGMDIKGHTRVKADGKSAEGWILSSMDDRTGRIDIVYYGKKTDISTPGQTVGQPLPVSLSYFRPTLENGEVVIRWTTESELDNAGFNILRSESRDGEFKQVNSELVQGAGTTGERNAYKLIDESAKPGVIYYYQIEDVSFAGEHQTLTTTKLKGLISAKNKLTTLWGGLKEVQ